MLYIVDGDGHRLLEQPILFELVGIYQRPDQTSVAIFVRVLL